MTEWLGCRSGSGSGWGVLVRIREWLGCWSGSGSGWGVGQDDRMVGV